MSFKTISLHFSIYMRTVQKIINFFFLRSEHPNNVQLATMEFILFRFQVDCYLNLTIFAMFNLSGPGFKSRFLTLHASLLDIEKESKI